MLPINWVCMLETAVFKAPTTDLRYFVGIFCLCTHGLKRWADVQHTDEVTLSKDALVLRCWKSKRKLVAMTWASLRVGYTGLDWGGEWFKLWSQLRAKPDYLATRPTVDMRAFNESIADHSDATRALHALLVRGGCGPMETSEFSTHS